MKAFYRVFRAQAVWIVIFPYERASPLAEKNAAAGLPDFEVRGAARRHFSR
jgi:hypothetical protein